MYVTCTVGQKKIGWRTFNISFEPIAIAAGALSFNIYCNF